VEQAAPLPPPPPPSTAAADTANPAVPSPQPGHGGAFVRSLILRIASNR
jgi:hypothetical protein